MRSRLALASLLASASLLAAPAAGAATGLVAGPSGGGPGGGITVTVGPGGGTPGTSRNFVVVGHDSLFGRGMNSAATFYQHYIYIGNRTDGSATCGVGDPRGPGANCPHPHPGVLIEDVADPAHPHVVGEIGPPFEGNTGISSREVRVWPRAKLLVVMNFRCSSVIHACPPGNDTQFPFDLKFYSLADPVHPRFISSYVPTSAAGLQVKPHEMYLWQDPKRPDRALLWISTPELTSDPTVPNLMIVDISKVAAGGPVTEVAQGNWNQLYPDGGSETAFQNDLYTHSMAPTADGTRTYLSMEGGEMLVLDTSAVARDGSPGEVINLNNDLITDPANRPIWGNPLPGCLKACPEGHSSVPLPGRPYVLTTDEIYGTFTDPTFGCPWGWVRLINVRDPAHPKIVSEYKIPQDLQSFCGSPADDSATEQFTSYSSHNPTVLPDLAFVDWHSGGLQAIDISNPAHTAQAGWFSPRPLDSVATEDPALSRGPNKVVLWSYPIIRNGLIYAIDIRNGLYILRYTGPHAREAASIHFFEGNSNLGDAVRLAQPHGR
ncbi:MAG: LVIVD repeat-containing protein [Micromonosporaceae bacterium]